MRRPSLRSALDSQNLLLARTRQEHERLKLQIAELDTQIETRQSELLELCSELSVCPSDVESEGEADPDEDSLVTESMSLLKSNLDADLVAPFSMSLLLRESLDFREVLHRWIRNSSSGDLSTTTRLLYRGSRDGFSPSDFHRLVDGKGRTLAIVQSTNGFLFGGFAEVSWSSGDGKEVDVFGQTLSPEGLWLFSLLNQFGRFPVRFRKKQVLPDTDTEMRCCRHGPGFFLWFGASDLVILADCQNSTVCVSELGGSFEFVQAFDGLEGKEGAELDLDSISSKTFLAGDPCFQVKEIEVFAI